MDNKAFLTMDSGGSKTKLRLYSFGGELIKESSAQGFGLAEVIKYAPLSAILAEKIKHR